MTATIHENRPVGEPPVADFGDVQAEFAALISGCGLFDLGGRAKIRLTGGDRVRWLNGMVTNNIRDLAVGRGVYAFLLNPQGRILGDLYAYNRGDSLLLDVEGARLPQLLELFDRYIIMDDVEVANVSEKWTAIGIAGPAAAEVLGKAGLRAELAPLQSAETSGPAGKVLLTRGDNPAIAAYELWIAPEEAPKLWDAILQAGARPAGTRAVELLRIAAGIPRYGQDIHERDLPQETGQERALNFSKGCYIGQEIVERIRSRGNVHRMFSGFRIEGPLPAAGTKLQAEDKEVGEITSAASLPLIGGKVNVGLGYVRREAANKALHAGEATATIAATPFSGVFSERVQ